ncbi:hypothetical protein BREVNS_1744 [Brevinematales bacterium NS]|nr:DUF1887 family protein [Brevinematales bacterium]QJR22494.1 hypothetical protein BREVNS_1744 [Brevinematales bacterium NS]
MDKKAMLCFSTQNQVVNLVPALLLGVNNLLVLSTERATREGWTENLKAVSEKRNIHTTIFELGNVPETDIFAIVRFIQERMVSDTSFFVNISGGQKPMALALYEYFKQSEKAEALVYMEGNQKKIEIYRKNGEKEEMPIKTHLELEEILSLYGYELKESPQELKIGASVCEQKIKHLDMALKMAEYYKTKELFQRLFLESMFRPSMVVERVTTDRIQKAIDKLKPELDQLGIAGDTGFGRYDTKMREMKKYIDTAKRKNDWREFQRLAELYYDIPRMYKEYWNVLKKKMAEYVEAESRHIQENGEYNGPIIDKRGIEEEKYRVLESWLTSCGGHFKNVEKKDGRYLIRSSNVIYFDRIGIAFEKMVVSEVVRILQEKSDLRERVCGLFYSVKTRKKGCTVSDKHDAEYDLVIVTSYGTLLLVEMKSGEFETDTARGKEHGAYQKSGPYGKSVIVGPMLSFLEGKEYHWVSQTIRDQKVKCEQAGLDYCYFDKIEEYLERKL